MLRLDLQYTERFISSPEIEQIKPQVIHAARQLDERTGPGSEFLGWADLPLQYDREEFERILAAADRIRRQSQVLVVIGIGGSYLGAKAALEFCGVTAGIEIVFAGANLSPVYHNALIRHIGDRDFSVNVISKSGTTTEPAIAFRLFRQMLENKYGRAESQKRVYATTDLAKGALRTLAQREGYETFVVPDNVGGRFSVLTAVGLLPIAVAGIDIQALIDGAADAREKYVQAKFDQNDCMRYVAARNILHRKGKDVEMLVNYEPRLHFVAEWWKQLFGESEGKDQKGIFTASADFTTDLHSLGQYIQDGKRHLFETLIEIDYPETDIVIPATHDDLDGLNYLAGKTMDYVNKKAAEGTLMAHVDGGVPNIVLRVAHADPRHLGALFYFFERACAISGYLLGVNPFDQPGVEAYKKNMFRLLGKP